jgi:hypothetical protein
VILILSAYESTEWVIDRDDKVQLQRIILNGYNRQTLSGAEGIAIDDYSGVENHIVSGVTRWSATHLGYQNGLAPEWVYRIETLAGVPLSTFSGCQRASSFSIGD